MVDASPKSTGCGLFGAVFGRRTFWLRRATSTGSIPSGNTVNTIRGAPTTSNSKRRRGGSDEASFLDQSIPSEEAQGLAVRSAQNQIRTPPPPVYGQSQGRRSDEAALAPARMSKREGYVKQGRKVPREAIGISGELEAMIADHQSSKGNNSTLVRASSSNVMLFGNLGNLRQGNSNLNMNSYSATSKNVIGGKKGNEEQPQAPTSLCRALSTRMDPETLKMMGNEDYKSGRFAEALALYDAAISVDPTKASYRSNKSAALTALGRLLEAVFECREAIRIDPRYHRAHHRLANLYIRLGEAEKAIYHCKLAGPEADGEDLGRAQSLQAHLTKCTEARRLRDWNTLVKEAADTISAGGADSAPQIYSLQAEGLLKLHRHQEADAVLSARPAFSIDDCTKFFGPLGNANILIVQAQVDLAAGRVEEAVEAAQRAARLDANNKDASTVLRRSRGVATARSKGNELFKAARFSEACVAYGEGLEQDPYNALLLCNRAACRAKLGQLEKAVQDCTAALNLRPAYSKARLRRADCNAKLERWKASIQDYEVLIRETEDEEEKKTLLEAQAKLKKSFQDSANLPGGD